MTPSLVNRRVFADRLATIDSALADIRALPLSDLSDFLPRDRGRRALLNLCDRAG